MRQLLTNLQKAFNYASSQPHLVYRITSKESNLIEVYQKGYEKQLVVGGLVQSVSADTPNVLQRVWGKIALLVKKHLKNVDSCLILGLGGGTVAHLLVRYYPDIIIDAVEFDPVIVDVGNRFFELRQLTNLNIVIADAFEVLLDPRNHGLRRDSYQVIVVDTYQGEVFPDKFSQEPFIQKVKDLISPGGLVIFNRIYSPRYRDAVARFERLLTDSFSEVIRQPVTGLSGSDNLLFVCS